MSDSKSGTEKKPSLSHDELVKLTKTTLTTLLKNDPLLCDLPENVTLDEINAQVGVLQGRGLSVRVERADGEVLQVVVEQREGTVSHLKKAVERCVTLRLERQGGRKKALSWKSVWKNNVLCFSGQHLSDDNAKLRLLGLTNKASVTFVKRRRDKNKNTD